MDLNLLKGLGLTEGEIKVYFALLELGSSKTGEISLKSTIHTSKVYPILDRLIEKGLASYIIENNVRYYQASNPDQILKLIEVKKRDLNEQEEKIKTIIPEILKKQKFAKYKQSAAVYEGIRGIKTAFESMLDDWKNGEDYIVMSPGDEFKSPEINKFFKKHHQLRIEKNIEVKVLALESQKEFYKKEYKNIQNIEFRFSEFSLPAGVNIVHNKVSMLIGEPIPIVYVIESEILATRFKTFFNKLWKVGIK